MIECIALSKRYGDRPAVDDLSFEVRPGVVTGFLGPNGAGKSTTMRLMLGLDHGGGTTLFDGTPFRSLPDPMRQVGSVLEAKAFHPTRSARNHLRMLAAATDVSHERVDEALELVGLTSVARKAPRGFSLGMAQRLGLASALLADPSTIILDEPANGLDPQGIRWLRTLLQRYANQGRTVFVSSHLLSEIEVLADELVVIGKGRLLARGTVAGFVERSARTAVVVSASEPGRLGGLLERAGARVRSNDGVTLEISGIDQRHVGDLAFEAGIRLYELTTHRATLEEAFLEATAGVEEYAGTLTAKAST